MNILVGAPVYPPSVGGVQTLSYHVARGLAERGHQVCVLARGRVDDPELDARAASVRVVRIGGKPLLWPMFAAQVFRSRPDVVLLTHRADFLRLATLARKALGLPWAVVVHGNELYGSPRRESLCGALAKADALIAVSRYTRGRLLEMNLPAEKVSVIPNGVSFGSFDGPEAGGAVRRRLGLEGKKVILSVGRLAAVKGFDAVIRDLPRVVERVPEAAYMIVGAGPEEGRLRSMARERGMEDRVLFLGEIPLGRMGRGAHAYYQACDVFAMPSREDPTEQAVEAFGIAHLEAGACGKPVVGGRSGGSGEAVAEGESGLLVDPEREGELAEALIRILTSPALAESMGAAGRKRAEMRRWEAVAAEYEAVLREAANG